MGIFFFIRPANLENLSPNSKILLQKHWGNVLIYPQICVTSFFRPTEFRLKQYMFYINNSDKGIICEVNAQKKKKINRKKKRGSKYKELNDEAYKSYLLIESQVDVRKDWFATPGVW